MCLIQYFISQFCSVFHVIRNLCPQEHASLVFVKSAAESFYDFFGDASTLLINHVVTFVPRCRQRQGVGGGFLHGTESPRVDVAFHAQYPRYELSIRGQHAYAPAGHIVRFAHRVHFDTDFFCSRDRQQAQRSVVENEAIRVVVDDDDVVATSEIDRFSNNSRLACAPVGMVGSLPT